MKRLIEEALRPLIGLALWDARWVGILHGFHFGERLLYHGSRGDSWLVGTYALHVQCAWRIASNNRVLVGSDDQYEEPQTKGPAASSEGKPPDITRHITRLDEIVGTLFVPGTEHRWIVGAVEADDVGGIALTFSGGAVFEVFPSHISFEEYWRLFEPTKDTGHFVVGCDGIEP